MRPALRAEERQRRLQDRKRTEKVNIQDVANFLRGGFFDCAKQAVARMVDDHIQPAVKRVRGSDNVPRLICVGEFERQDVQRVVRWREAPLRRRETCR